MDSADYAALQEELAWQDLERRIAASRGQSVVVLKSTCEECGEPLAQHRLEYGKAEHERKAGWL